MKKLTVLALTFFVAVTVVRSQERPKEGEWIAWKKKQIRQVAHELKVRDTSHLTPGQIEARIRHIKVLEDYAARGRFPVNSKFGRTWMPYFIGPKGNRCALAHILEADGQVTLLSRLNEEANNAYISQLGFDKELVQWLRENGLSQEEIAYIQAPSIIDRPPTDTPVTQPPQTPRDTPRTPGFRPPNTGPVGGPPVPGGISTGRPRARGTSSRMVSWDEWWRLNRNYYVNVRDRYHDREDGFTANVPKQEKAEDFAPTQSDKSLFVTRGLAPLKKDPAYTIAVLMAEAEAAGGVGTEGLAAEILTQLKRKRVQHREYGLLALGLTKTAAGRLALQEVVSNSSKGRKVMGRSNKVPARVRAFAAYALGFDGDESSRKALSEVLEAKSSVQADLQVAAAYGLALIDRHAEVGKSIPLLQKIMLSKKRPLMVRSQIPSALAMTQDRSALAVVIDPVKKFALPAEVRRGCALAVGSLATGLEADPARILMMSARRDPDANVREFSIVALGKMSWRDSVVAGLESDDRKTLLNETAEFFVDGVSGFFKQPIDQPWYSLAAGLFVETHPSFAKKINKQLIKQSLGNAWDQTKSASAIGLSLAGSSEGKVALRAQFAKEKAPRLKGYMAEALGILRDGDSKDQVRELALDSRSDFLRYQGASALASMGDRSIAPDLVKALAGTKSGSVRAGLTNAIGQMGDRRTMAALLEIAKNKKMSQETRLRAVSSLGFVSRKSPEPWTQPIRENLNPSTLQGTLGIMASIF